MKFGGSRTKCSCCEKTVYPMEMIKVDSATLHKQCFTCKHCKRQLTLSSFASVGNNLYCKTHFIELFHSSGGKYSVFGADASFRKKASGSFGPTPMAKPRRKDSETSKKDSETSFAPAYSQPPIANAFKAIEMEESPPTSRKKHMSLKDRLLAYEKVAKLGSSSDYDATEELQEEQVEALQEEEEGDTETEAEGGEEEEEEEEEAAAATKQEEKGKELVASKVENGETIEYLREEVFDLRIANRNLEERAEALQDENTALTKKLRKLTEELALQTAKALEADEWCAKLSKDLEALKATAAS